MTVSISACKVHHNCTFLSELGLTLTLMTRNELQQCLEDAFGSLEPPYFDESFRGSGLAWTLEDLVRTDTTRTKRWQKLRPLTQYLNGSLAIFRLTSKAFQYYLPAFLYAMTDPSVVWQYLGPVLSTLWYENEDGEPLHNNPDLRLKWEEDAAILTDRQKRCISHFLVEILKQASEEEDGEVSMEADRIEHMLKKYWNAWL